jgi:hypothetical protein
MQAALCLAPELAGDVAVGDAGDDCDWKKGASDEQEQEATPEPALQWCRS